MCFFKDMVCWRFLLLGGGGGAVCRWHRAELWLVEEHNQQRSTDNSNYEHNAYDFIGAKIKS